MARKRIEGTMLESWDQVDEALRQIGIVDREIALIEGGANERIDQIKAEMKTATAAMLDKKTGLEIAVKEYCEANRADFAKVKTKALTFGTVGFRLSTKVVIKRIADTLQALKDLGLNHCIRIKEEPDKEAMKALPIETLAEVGANLKTENVFGYDLNVEKLREVA